MGSLVVLCSERVDVDGMPHSATLAEAATASGARLLIARGEYLATRSALSFDNERTQANGRPRGGLIRGGIHPARPRIWP